LDVKKQVEGTEIFCQVAPIYDKIPEIAFLEKREKLFGKFL
jgi:hypothetical protein